MPSPGAPSLDDLTTEFIRGEGMGGGVGGMVYSLKHPDPSAQSQEPSIICSHANHRGDVIARSDDNCSLTSFALYEAYGTRPYEWGSDPDRQKANTKEEESGLGLLNEGMRYRDFETGVFLTRDPIRYEDGPNVYCYVHCNPITKFDAWGLKARIANYDDRKVIMEQLQKITSHELKVDKHGVISIAHRANRHESETLSGDKLVEGILRSKYMMDFEVDGWNENGIRRDLSTSANKGDVKVYFNPADDPEIPTLNADTRRVSKEKGRPAYIGLAHEMIHGWRWMDGKSSTKKAKISDAKKNMKNYDPSKTYKYEPKARYTYVDAGGKSVTQTVALEELQTVGLGGHNKPGDITENDIRKEHASEGVDLRGAY